ncbi:MAG: PTS mannitol transporter subunit IICBA [Dermabacter sp.]|nr:PTS mannitol transporter subunit IICBA [Dermabacter sp.]
MSETATRERGSARVMVQKVGTGLSNMVMPNIPALIAWGLFTALFIPKGWLPNESLSSIVGPMIHYLLPLLIANTGGRMIYGDRGAVVGVASTMGVIAGSDWLIAEFNATLPADAAPLPEVHMFIGAMIMAPLAAWLMKKLDALWRDYIPAGFEMLVNLFSAGIFSFLMALVGFFGLAPIINWVMDILGSGVDWLIENQLLPLVSILIEPAKVFFLNNAINHGVLTPLATAESAVSGKSILYLLEANPGPGLGILLAFTFFGVGMAKASAPGAAIIHFFGGIHEIYFPYVLMRPMLILAAIAGGMTGVATNMVFQTGLVAPAAPGSIIAIMAQAARGTHLGVLLSVALSAAVSFAVAALILKFTKGGDGDLDAATKKMEDMKGKKSSVAGALTGSKKIATDEDSLAVIAAEHPNDIRKIVFACDAGMGSSAMGASVLRKKVRAAGFSNIEVVNQAISNLNDEWDLIVTHEDLADRAYPRTPGAIHVAVDNFMNSPRYDEVVALLERRAAGVEAPVPAGVAAAGAAAGTDAQAAPVGGAGSGEPSADGDASILSEKSIVLNGVARSMGEAIEEAGNLLLEAEAVDRSYIDAMHEREASVSTFMGNGLAIPHGTNEAKEAIHRTAMSVVRYATPLDWNGQQVDFVVAIAGLGDEHLSLLQNIAVVFADEEQVNRLRAAGSRDEILAIFSAG